MSRLPGPSYEDLLAQEIVRRASEDDLARSSSAPAVASLAIGVVGWIGLGFLLLLLLALAGCAVSLS
jgi:hypothetical protein